MYKARVNVTLYSQFYGEELSAPRQTLKLEDHPLLAVCDFFFIIFTVTLHIGENYIMRSLMICTPNPVLFR